MSNKILIDNVSGQDVMSGFFESAGGVAVVNIRGVFGPANVIIQIASKNDFDVGPRWLGLTDGTFTDQATVKLDYLPAGMLVRASLSGADGTTENVFVEVVQ